MLPEPYVTGTFCLDFSRWDSRFAKRRPVSIKGASSQVYAIHGITHIRMHRETH